jgi:tetratricopeptide (TPR) repeat protein
MNADAMLSNKQFTEARAAYAELIAKHPQAAFFETRMARAYHAEGNTAKAIEHLRSALQKEPENVEAKLLLGQTLIDAGQAEEGKQILTSVDDAKVTDPAVFFNVGIDLIKQGKHADAIPWFDRTIKLFPNDPDAYYWRGVCHMVGGNKEIARADLEKFVSIAPPDSPNLAAAKQALESMK